MNDIRRTILWVIFGFSMVLLWDKWQLHNGNKATFFPTTPAVTAPAAAAGAASGATGAASVPRHQRARSHNGRARRGSRARAACRSGCACQTRTH